MRLLMKHDGTYLCPSSADSVEKYEKLRRGQEYTVEIKQARNPAFHRKAFALLNAMFENQSRIENIEDFRLELKLICKHVREYVRPNGEIVYIPKSWSFADLDEIEFEALYSKLLSVAAKRFGDEFIEGFV